MLKGFSKYELPLYPFGLKHQGYNGKERQIDEGDSRTPTYAKHHAKKNSEQTELNLNWDSFKWRNYDYAIGRFMSVDPLSEKYSYQSHYNFNENRVIDARELEGLEPHILFNSRDKAAENFGQQYNGKSILKGKEYGATIYSRKTEDGTTLYAYNKPRKGRNDGVLPRSRVPRKANKEALIHSHGKYEEDYLNNEFSDDPGDKSFAEKKKLDMYVTTPNGSLMVYYIDEKVESVLPINIQSDPNDPDRKNEIDPVENPKPVETEPVKIEGKKSTQEKAIEED